VDHYFVVVFLLIVPGITVYNLYQMYVTDTYTGARSARELILAALPFLILSIAFIFIQTNGLKFKEIKINYTEDDFLKAVNMTVGQLKWEIQQNDNQVFRAYRHWNWTASWGEMITIIKQEDRLLINSICDLNKRSSVTSWGWNKKNIETFKSNLLSVTSKR
jgi:hypothetical protein